MTESTDVNLRLAQAIEWDMNVRDWEHDMNACLRDIVPVLRAGGWRYRIQDDVEDVWVEMRRVRPEFRFQPSAEFAWTGFYVWMQAQGSRGVSLPAAFCEAAEKALETRESPDKRG